MKKLKITYFAFLMLLGIAACELPENVNPKAPTEVPASSLFANGTIELVNQVNSISVNENISRILAQYVAQTTYTNESSQYDFQDRNIPNTYFRNFYRNSLMDLKEAKMQVEALEGGITAATKANQLAAIDVLEVYAYHCLVDAFGDVPYTEALQGVDNATPAYDKAEDIYSDLITRLTTASDAFSTDGDVFGSFDLMYGDDAAGWKAFANSLKLRLGMRIGNSSAVSSAVTAGVFGPGESAALNYDGTLPHVNSVYEEMVAGGRIDYLPANTIVDLMNGLNDPRRPLYFTTDENGEADGYDGAQYGTGNTYGSTSFFSSAILSPSFPATLIDYAEVEFLLAEAVERGYITGDAATHYNNAITASITNWGGSATDAATYLAQVDVAYATAPGTFEQKIGTQKYIALWNRGVEAWAEWRRLDYPIFNVPPDLTYDDIPVRMPYPYNEDELNATNYEAASSSIGGDSPATKLFWDKN